MEVIKKSVSKWEIASFPLQSILGKAYLNKLIIEAYNTLSFDNHICLKSQNICRCPVRLLWTKAVFGILEYIVTISVSNILKLAFVHSLAFMTDGFVALLLTEG